MINSLMSPLMGMISQSYPNISQLTIKGILTIPPIFVLLISLFFPILTKKFKIKTLSIFGIICYLAGGYGISFIDNIYIILLFRAISGIGVGILMPISTVMITYLFPKEKSSMIGIASAINQLGAVVALVLSNVLSVISWKYSMSVYLIGIIPLFFALFFLPNISFPKSTNQISNKILLKKVFSYAFSTFCTMGILFVIPSSFSIFAMNTNLITVQQLGLILGLQPFCSFLGGLIFSKMPFQYYPMIRITASINYIIAYIGLSLFSSFGSFVIIMIVIGVSFGMLLPMMMSMATKIVTSEEIPSTMAILSFSIFLSQSFFPNFIQIIQNIFQNTNPRFSFYMASILSILFTIYLFNNKEFNDESSFITSK